MGDSKIIAKSGDYRRLGATIEDGGTNFAIFSAHASRVELCIFDGTGTHEIGRVDLPEYTNEVWHGFVPRIGADNSYGYRVHGPFEPESGHRFNPAKLLLDPYAKGYVNQLKWSDAHYGYDVGADADKDLTQNLDDNASGMPKCQIIDPAFDWSNDRKPEVSWAQTVFYETHVKGYTIKHPAVPEALRGTFEGMAQAEVVDYIRSLGITSVELLPIHAFVNDHHLEAKGLNNFWGYNTIGFFAPHRPYLGPACLHGLKTMIRRLHDAGIEVILDVVYNHTAEGNELGPTLSFKGIDNFAYYRTMPDKPRYYINDTGTGNTVNTSHPRVLQMVMDSLRYWVDTFHIDGFRFDLGTILGREPGGFDQRGGFFDAIGQDPALSQVKLIGEPWDIGPGGYQVGGFPPGWSEWNDKYRDTVRAYWKGEEGKMRDLAARVTGSGDVYDLRGRRPWAGVNFITAHDGFTLNDLVSYNEKHNEANGEDNKDGHGDNQSFNFGVEGPTDDPAIRSARARQRRNLLATLLLSHGTPMILAGDEFARTQGGNNNGYAQDNEISWVNWDKIGRSETGLIDFTRHVLKLRHDRPIFHRESFRDGMIVEWLNPGGGFQGDDHWEDEGATTIGLRLKRDADRESDDVLVIFNAHDGMVPFVLPKRESGDWKVLLDTAMGGEGPYAAEKANLATGAEGQVAEVFARSLLVLE